MNCSQCRENQTVDGVIPDCESGKGCLIPLVPEYSQRLLTLRGVRVALKNLVEPRIIFREFEREHGELTWFDLELLAAVETELRPEPEEPPHGEGC